MKKLILLLFLSPLVALAQYPLPSTEIYGDLIVDSSLVNEFQGYTLMNDTLLVAGSLKVPFVGSGIANYGNGTWMDGSGDLTMITGASQSAAIGYASDGNVTIIYVDTNRVHLRASDDDTASYLIIRNDLTDAGDILELKSELGDGEFGFRTHYLSSTAARAEMFVEDYNETGVALVSLDSLRSLISFGSANAGNIITIDTNKIEAKLQYVTSAFNVVDQADLPLLTVGQSSGLTTFNSNKANTSPVFEAENDDGDFQVFVSSASPENVITGDIGDWCTEITNGVVYLKTSDAGSNTGWSAFGGTPTYFYSSITRQSIGSGTNYSSGHYDYSDTDANLNQGSPTVAHGSANEMSAAHASIVAGSAGSASGGSGAVEIEVSGTSVTDAGVRTGSDTEILVADITTMSTNDFYESNKKWVGTVVYTLQNASGSTQTTFDADFNYGHCAYDDAFNSNFEIVHFLVDGLARNNDTDFEVRLLYHSTAGWTYAATGFVPGNGEICSTTDYTPEDNLVADESFRYKRTNLSQQVNGGDANEGYLIEITTSAGNVLDICNFTIGVLLQ